MTSRLARLCPQRRSMPPLTDLISAKAHLRRGFSVSSQARWDAASSAFTDDAAINVGRCYFRTQITRTTDALASDDPSDPLTPLALRKSRTVSDGTSAACAAGAAFGGPATITGFNSAMPANLPSLSCAAAPEKPTVGAGDSAKSLPPPTWVTETLTLLTAAPPPWFCG